MFNLRFGGKIYRRTPTSIRTRVGFAYGVAAAISSLVRAIPLAFAESNDTKGSGTDLQELQHKTGYTLEQLKEKTISFQQRYPHGMDLEAFAQSIHSTDTNYARAIFNAIDTNGNGVIEVEEYLVYCSIAHGGSPKARRDFQFHIYDQGNKGYITLDDITRLLKMHLTVEAISPHALTAYNGFHASAEQTAFNIVYKCHAKDANKVSREDFDCIAHQMAWLKSYIPPRERAALVQLPFTPHYPDAHEIKIPQFNAKK